VEDISEVSAAPYTRVCAIDIGKAGLVACVRVPHETRTDLRVQEVREYATVTPALLALADWLRCHPGAGGGDGGDVGVLEGGVLPVGGRGVHLLAAERQAREERPRPSQDGPVNRTMARGVLFRATGGDQEVYVVAP
jgi:hypothetical protein